MVTDCKYTSTSIQRGNQNAAHLDLYGNPNSSWRTEHTWVGRGLKNTKPAQTEGKSHRQNHCGAQPQPVSGTDMLHLQKSVHMGGTFSDI